MTKGTLSPTKHNDDDDWMKKKGLSQLDSKGPHHGSCQKKHGRSKKTKKGGVTWDEHNLEENERIKMALNPMKIDEPKTPYHHSEEDDVSDDESLGMSPLSLSDDVGRVEGMRRRRSMFEEQLEMEESVVEETEEDKEKRRKFVEARKQHYKVGKHLLSKQMEDTA